MVIEKFVSKKNYLRHLARFRHTLLKHNPKTMPHKVYIKLSDTNTDHIDEWCYEHFGIQGEKWDAYFASEDTGNYDQFYIFANHDDAMLFSLRWL